MSDLINYHHDHLCGCTGRDGRPKRLYATHAEAQESADYVWRKRGVRLRVYSCPYCAGYHLTSDLHGGGW
jgi:hypothetical protein